MKPRFQLIHFRLPTMIALTGILSSATAVRGEAIFKSDTGTDLSAGASWIDDSPPGPEDVATWDSGSLGTGLTLPSSASWLGIDIPAGLADIDITGAGTLTLGTSGITAASSITIGIPVILGTDQIWTATSPAVVQADGSVTGSGQLSLLGAGTINLTASNSHSGGTVRQGIGVLGISNSSALGSGNLTLASTRGIAEDTVILSGGITIPNAITINLDSGREGILSSTGNNTLSGNIDFVGSASNHVYFENVAGEGTTFTLSGSVTAPNMTEGISFRGDPGNLGLVSGQVNISGFFEINGGATWTIASTGNNWSQTRIQGADDGGFTLGADNALATSARVWFGNNTDGALDLAGFDQTIGGIDCPATVNNPKIGNSSTASDSLLSINGNGHTFAGSLVDTLGDGDRTLSIELLSGIQTLTGLGNSYSGTTTISGGTLWVNGSLSNTSVTVMDGGRLGGNGSVGGTVAVQSGGTLKPGNSTGSGTLDLANLVLGAGPAHTQTITYPGGSGGIAVSGTLTANGTTTIDITNEGVVALGLVNLITYTGTTITSGFELGNKPPRVEADLVYEAGAIAMNVTSAGDTIKWTGENGGQWNTTDQNFQLVNGGTSTAYIDGSPGDSILFDDSSLLGGTAVVLNDTFTPTAVRFDGAADFSLTGSGDISGETGITKAGTGKLTLGTDNSFTGPVTVSAGGSLEITHANALGSPAEGTTVINGGALILPGGVNVTAEPLNIRGAGIGNAGAIRNVAGNNSWAGPISLSNSLRIGAESGLLTLGPIIAGIRTLVVSGPGNVTIEGPITQTTGGITVDNNFNPATPTGTVTLKGTHTGTGPITIPNGTLNMEAIRTSSPSAITIGAGASQTGVLNFSTGDFSSGVGNLALASGNTATATLNLTGGTFAVINFTSLSTGENSTSTITIGGDAEVLLPAFPINRGANATATITFDGGILRPTAASEFYLSDLTNAYLTASGARFDVPTGRDVTISQAFENATAQIGTLTKSGPGTLTLTGTNTYSGRTLVSEGTLATTGNSIPDGGRLDIQGGKFAASGVEIVNVLFIDNVQQPAGSYGATGVVGADFTDDDHFAGTGLLEVLTGPSPIASYADWAAAYAPGQSADMDHDGDGVENGVEYFMGETGSTFTANPAPVDGKIIWAKSPSFNGSYLVQTSDTMQANDWGDVEMDDPNLNDTGSSVEYSLPTGQGKIFARLTVNPS